MVVGKIGQLLKMAAILSIIFICYAGTRAQTVEGECPNIDVVDSEAEELVIEEVCPDPMLVKVIDAIHEKLEIYKKAPRMTDEQIEEVAKAIIWGWEEYGFPPQLLLSMMEQESGFNYRVVSKHGAVGLMQVIPKYSKRARNRLGLVGDAKKLLLTPHLNVRIAIVMFYNFRVATKTTSDPRYYVALMAYNAGEVIANRFYKNKSHDVKGKYASLVTRRIKWYADRGIA